MRRKKVDIIRFKWLANDCKTWKCIIKALEDRIKFIKKLEKLGCKIVENNNDDYIFYSVPSNKVKEYCKLVGITEEELECFHE